MLCDLFQRTPLSKVPCAEAASEPWQVSYDEVHCTVADAIKEELVFMRELQVYHEVLVSYLDKSGLEVYTHKGDAANPFIRARNQESERVDTRGREQHVCSYAPTGKSEGHAQSMHYWETESTC